MTLTNDTSSVSYEMIAKALFENYESIYDIDLKTHAYKTYFQSDSYQELNLSNRGSDFFRALPTGVQMNIAEEDRDYVLHMLQKDVLLLGLQKEKYYSMVYRIQTEGGMIYHQLRATLQPVEGGMHILMGIKNIDDIVRQQIAQNDAMEAMREKEKNHLEAVLASASAYMEANLSLNMVLEKSESLPNGTPSMAMQIPSVEEISDYDEMQNWIADHLISRGRRKYRAASHRKHLLALFQKGDRRASVLFSVRNEKAAEDQPCRAVFYLYQEKSTQDVHVFCVVYDLTQEQRREQELEVLEKELMLSRIRNSTSQMQPHFLYNALGSIQEVILMDPQYASDLLGDFTVHLRSCVRAMTRDDPIPFFEELKNIQAYVNIEKMRLGEKLAVQYDIEAEDFLILPLSVQPLVENAIRHGIYPRGRIGGTVTVRSRQEAGDFVIQVCDDGIGFDADQLFREIESGKKDSTGLMNIRFRLEKVMGATVDIESEPGAGTAITIRVPGKE